MVKDLSKRKKKVLREFQELPQSFAFKLTPQTGDLMQGPEELGFEEHRKVSAITFLDASQRPLANREENYEFFGKVSTEIEELWS